MKRTYEAPRLDVDIYNFTESITANCAHIVHNGPALGNHERCSDYTDPYPEDSMITPQAEIEAVYNVNFYEDTNCTCYTTGANSGYWMS